jgi:hypothetical protein
MIATFTFNNIVWHKSSRSAGQTDCLEVRDEEAVGSNPATPTLFQQVRG